MRQMVPYFKPGVELEVAEQIKHKHCSGTRINIQVLIHSHYKFSVFRHNLIIVCTYELYPYIKLLFNLK